MNRDIAEKRWRKAKRELDNAYVVNAIVNAMAREQDAWEEYTEVCNDLGECLAFGCHTHTPDHVHCEQHRD